MPIVSIYVKQGDERAYLKSLMHVTMDGVGQVFQLPPNDTNICVAEYDPDLFAINKGIFIKSS
ncbi:MAG: hypothetical protein PF517_07620 [Salinivirgaceae bacterium]|jgi:phenylpyruvate tautomerase PptA (4-oxalocrotonate tautomerase family)|nr:hypothetical protein [Salinivirgaceae bacterium]